MSKKRKVTSRRNVKRKRVARRRGGRRRSLPSRPAKNVIVIHPDADDVVPFPKAVKAYDRRSRRSRSMDERLEHRTQLTMPTKSWLKDNTTADVIGIDAPIDQNLNISKQEREQMRALERRERDRRVKGKMKVSREARAFAKKHGVTVITAQRWIDRVKAVAGKDNYDKIDYDALWDDSLEYAENVKNLERQFT